jgi:hypothetical protein
MQYLLRRPAAAAAVMSPLQSAGAGWLPHQQRPLLLVKVWLTQPAHLHLQQHQAWHSCLPPLTLPWLLARPALMLQQMRSPLLLLLLLLLVQQGCGQTA